MSTVQRAHGRNQAHSTFVQQKFAPEPSQGRNIVEDLGQVVDCKCAAAGCGRRQTADTAVDAALDDIAADRSSRDGRKAAQQAGAGAGAGCEDCVALVRLPKDAVVVGHLYQLQCEGAP
jgi:hypothetical protein